MPDSNGMSPFDAQPVNNQQFSGDINLQDPSSYETMSFNQFIDSDELLKYVPKHWSKSDIEYFRDTVRGSPNVFGNAQKFLNWITGRGPTASQWYQDYKSKADARNDLLNQYGQFSRLGISPYMLLDNTSVSASGSTNLRQKNGDDSSAMSRLFGLMIMALARIAAAAM